MTTHNVVSFYRTRLQKPILSTDTVPFDMFVADVPGVPDGYITISPGTSHEEIMEYSTINSSNSTIHIIARGIDPSASTQTSNVIYQFSHQPLVEVRGDLNHLHLKERPVPTDNVAYSGNNSYAGTSTFNGSSTFNADVKVNNKFNGPTFASTAARDAVYTAPVSGDKCLITGTGEQYYDGGWQTLGVSTPTPNGSTTVAGKFEEATQAETDAGTLVGGTGADLVVTPATLQQGITNKLSSNAQALAGSDNTTLMTPLGVNDRIVNDRATLSDLIAGTSGKSVTAPYSGKIVQKSTTVATLSVRAAGDSATYSSSVQLVNGGIVDLKAFGEDTTGINTNRWGAQVSTDNTNWTTIFTQDFGGGNNRFIDGCVFFVNAGSYIRVFAGGIGSYTGYVTVNARYNLAN